MVLRGIDVEYGENFENWCKCVEVKEDGKGKLCFLCFFSGHEFILGKIWFEKSAFKCTF